MDGRTGKPIPNEHTLIFVTDDANFPKKTLIDRSTDENGIVLVQFEGAPPKFIQVFVDWHILCIKTPNSVLYSTEEIVEHGVIASNQCGEDKVSPTPGDIYIYARPRHWWEPT